MDHRLARDWVQEHAADKSILNIFCYTGAFSVAALLGGARHVTSVDLSTTYLNWLERNLALNDCQHQRHTGIKADCLDWLQQPAEHRYDIIIADPPTFSNSTAMAKDWRVQRDHGWLLWRLADRLEQNGIGFFSTNDRGFELTQAPPLLEVVETTPDSLPEDFRNRRIHRCWRFTRRQLVN